MGEQFFLVNNRIICTKDFESMSADRFSYSAGCQAAATFQAAKRPLAELPPNCDLARGGGQVEQNAKTSLDPPDKSSNNAEIDIF